MWWQLLPTRIIFTDIFLSLIENYDDPECHLLISQFLLSNLVNGIHLLASIFVLIPLYFGHFT